MKLFRLPSRLFILMLCAAWPSVGLASCPGPSLAESGLVQTECFLRDDFWIAHYAGAELTSIYATAFDHRKVAVAIANRAPVANSDEPLEVVELASVRELVKPPAEDQVVTRNRKAPLSRRGWVIFVEEIQYAAQGGGPGFVFDCAKAVRVRNLTVTAVAECFSVEYRARFFNLLDTIR